ncbi:MAG TPA: hypothetical protein VNX68_02865 [Nitrosopumilaceae archaeon]|jgi:hypothetical protein|nr:hypothetical protein [Nitrosopumilaceae archaeon]
MTLSKIKDFTFAFVIAYSACFIIGCIIFFGLNIQHTPAGTLFKTAAIIAIIGGVFGSLIYGLIVRMDEFRDRLRTLDETAKDVKTTEDNLRDLKRTLNKMLDENMDSERVKKVIDFINTRLIYEFKSNGQ